MLRDSFLDLIPALCFHIHGWEDGSLCQSILFLCGDSAVKRKIVERNNRRFSVPTQNIFPFTLRANNCEIRGCILRNAFQRDQLRFVFRFSAVCKGDFLCVTTRVGAIERRKSKTIFCDGVFQFRSVSSVINAYDTSLSQRPEFAIHPR